MIQTAVRSWPAGAAHDTVRAILRGRAFHRSLRNSIAERLMLWVGEWLDRLVQLVRGAPAARVVAIGLAALLVALVAARALLAARARGDGMVGAGRGARIAPGEDPWRAAEAFVAQGRFEDAAHAFYHAVVTSVSQRERIRLDPSKTSGDYARELRRRGSPAFAAYRAFVRRFEAGVFGRAGCDAALIDDLRRLAAPFRSAARAA